MTWVPVIDLTADDAVDAIAVAAERVGFFTIIGHGIDPEIIDAAWSSTREFFDAPIDERSCVAMVEAGDPYGWSPLGGETLSRSIGVAAVSDLKQSYAIGPVDPPTHEITDPDERFAWSENLWPEHPAGLRPAWEAYYRAMAALAARLLSMMAVALEMPPDHFEPLIDRHTSAMRALDYPGRDDLEAMGLCDHSDERLGASAHTDYGTLTILLADPEQAGLQIQAPDGSWRNVDAVPGSFVVNLGDAMARWTNDRWRSTMHRVLVPDQRRQSIAFFHNANWDAIIECLPGALGPGEVPRYAPIAAGPHLMAKFRSTVID